MKKNMMMRIASVLLIAVLMSTSAISGTYAKYVTSDSGIDNARVAKFGVVATVDGTLFAKSYVQVDDGNTPADSGELTVVTSTGDKRNLVAPGTQNGEGMDFVLTGTPEVDVNVEFKFEVVDNKEVMLASGNYTDDPTTGEANDAFNVADNYYPVVFTLKNNGTVLASGNVAAIQNYLTTNLNKIYNANTDLSDIAGNGSGEYTLTWAWDFETGHDVEDTYLGNAAVGDPFPTAGATTEMEVMFTITVTQVD